MLNFHIIVDSSYYTLLTMSCKAVSKAPNGRATDAGILIHDGTLAVNNLILQDFAPTYINFMSTVSI